MITGLETLLLNVIAAPDDDTPRTLVADWHDDHGDPNRAAFIRMQVALARAKPGELVKDGFGIL